MKMTYVSIFKAFVLSDGTLELVKATQSPSPAGRATYIHNGGGVVHVSSDGFYHFKTPNINTKLMDYYQIQDSIRADSIQFLMTYENPTYLRRYDSFVYKCPIGAAWVEVVNAKYALRDSGSESDFGIPVQDAIILN